MKRLLLPLSAIIIAFATIPAASASPILSNPTITSGALTFYNFGCNFVPMGAASTGTCAQTSVVASASSGITFTTGITTANIGTPDLAINFYVTGPVSTAGLSFTPVITGPEILSITELIYPYLGSVNPLATLYVVCTNQTTGGNTCGAGSILSASASFAAQTGLYIEKDIAYKGTTPGSVGDVTTIVQTFATPVTMTPEPASLGLLGGGLALFGLVNLRRRK